MTTTHDDPLSRLVVNDAGINRELLAITLEKRIRLDLGNGTFSFLNGARSQLNSRKQVLVALLAQKALHLLKAEFSEGLRPQEIERVTGIKGGTLRPVLKMLVERQMLRNDQTAGYIVPGYAVEDTARFLDGSDS